MHKLLLIIFVILLAISIRKVCCTYSTQRRRLMIRYSLYSLAFILTTLILSGRIHWTAAGIAGVLPLLSKLNAFFMRIFRFFYQASTSSKESQTHHRERTFTQKKNMDIIQARKIFGFNSRRTEKEIIQRHRELIQKNHPDRGGSDFLAAQINEAKDILLKNLR